MRVEETALDLTGLIYDAALAPEKWPIFMERLGHAMGTRSAMLREVNYDARDVSLFETVGYDPTYVAAYRDHFVNLDYFAPTFVSMPVGTVMRGDEVVPWALQHKSEFYNDYLLAQNNRHVIGGVLARNNHYHLQFGLQRELGRSDFDDKDMRLLRLVATHMARAVLIQRQTKEVTTQKHWALSALDRLRVGVILLDGQGKPLHLNLAAEHLVSGHLGFSAGRHGLSLASPIDTACLRRLIAAAAGLSTGRGSAAGGCLRVSVTEGAGAALQLQVIPLPQGLSERPWEQSLPGGCVAVFVIPATGLRPSWSRMMAMHGLTRAEAKLGSILAEGVRLEDAAEALSVSINTARSQLKSVFNKTGVTRQAELVALLLTDMLAD